MALWYINPFSYQVYEEIWAGMILIHHWRWKERVDHNMNRWTISDLRFPVWPYCAGYGNSKQKFEYFISNIWPWRLFAQRLQGNSNGTCERTYILVGTHFRQTFRWWRSRRIICILELNVQGVWMQSTGKRFFSKNRFTSNTRTDFSFHKVSIANL